MLLNLLFGWLDRRAEEERNERQDRMFEQDSKEFAEIQQDFDKIIDFAMILELWIGPLGGFFEEPSDANLKEIEGLFGGVSEEQKKSLIPEVKEFVARCNYLDGYEDGEWNDENAGIVTMERAALRKEIAALDKMANDIKAKIETMKKGTVANV